MRATGSELTWARVWSPECIGVGGVQGHRPCVCSSLHGCPLGATHTAHDCHTCLWVRAVTTLMAPGDTE